MAFDPNNPFGLTPEELALMPKRVKATRANFLTLLDDLRPKDGVVIHPLDGLTRATIYEMLKAQGYGPGDFVVMGHSNVLWVIKSAVYVESRPKR